MRKNRDCLIIVLFALMLLVGGCSGISSSQPNVPSEKDLNNGGKGLVLKMLSNMPPDEVWVNKQFQVGFEVSNKEIIPINNAVVSITACNGVSFDSQKADMQQIQNLNGKTKFNPDGDISRTYSYSLTAVKDDMECLFTTELCYGSETKVDADVCIDPDIYDLKKNKVCKIKILTLPAQAAPVVVTKIEEDIIPQEQSMQVRFKIFIENAESGQVTSLNSFSKICSRDVFSSDELNKVEISARLSNDPPMLCDPSILTMTPIRESNYFVCYTDIDKNKEAFTTPLVLDLRYGYVSTQYKKIKVKKEFT